MIHRAILNHETYVVEGHGELIAYGILEYTFFGNGFISMVYVDERHRRKGTGELLLRYLMKVCSTPKVFSSTNLSNTHMHILFHKLSFEGSGMVHHLDEGDPEVIYVRLPDLNLGRY